LGKLTVDGLIDPTGLELTPVGSNPGGVANNTLWLDSTDSNKLKLGSSEVSGGGSGDITGVTITTDSGGSSKAEDTGGSADFSILGATGVGVTNSGATITAVAVPSEIDHDALSNFVAAEHVDWAGASAGTIHASNYTDTNTQLSNAEVRTAVEAATDSNVFTDADHSKLNAIEPSADVTDTANVTAAGALMDSEVTNLADVKAFNPAAYATAAQGANADTALQPGSALAPGDPVSALANDAGYFDAATTPTSIFGRWELTSAVDGLAEATDNTLAVDDSSGFTRTGTLTGFSSGTFTANAATAGTYLVYARIHFGDSTTGTSIAETSGNKYTIQILMYHGSTMEGFGRIQKNGFWVDDHLDCTSIITLADGDTLQIKHKVVDHAASGTKYRIKNGGGNPANAIIMVKLA